jgi:hypothetical protein
VIWRGQKGERILNLDTRMLGIRFEWLVSSLPANASSSSSLMSSRTHAYVSGSPTENTAEAGEHRRGLDRSAEASRSGSNRIQNLGTACMAVSSLEFAFANLEGRFGEGKESAGLICPALSLPPIGQLSNPARWLIALLPDRFPRSGHSKYRIRVHYLIRINRRLVLRIHTIFPCSLHVSPTPLKTSSFVYSRQHIHIRCIFSIHSWIEVRCFHGSEKVVNQHKRFRAKLGRSTPLTELPKSRHLFLPGKLVTCE